MGKLLFVAAGLLALSGLMCRAEEMPEPQEWGKLHAVLKPTPAEEQWLQIPWRTRLWEARQEAAATGKPLLLWEMDGHPLGCT